MDVGASDRWMGGLLQREQEQVKRAMAERQLQMMQQHTITSSLNDPLPMLMPCPLCHMNMPSRMAISSNHLDLVLFAHVVKNATGF